MLDIEHMSEEQIRDALDTLGADALGLLDTLQSLSEGLASYASSALRGLPACTRDELSLIEGSTGLLLLAAHYHPEWLMGYARVAVAMNAAAVRLDPEAIELARENVEKLIRFAPLTERDERAGDG